MKLSADGRDLKIATIIPLYNGAKYIESALRSVIAQTVQPTEVIVVDDGSTDDGAKIVRRIAAEYPIRLLSKPNGGQSAARNFGVAHITGDFVAMLDQDDIWYPNHLEELVKPFLQTHQPTLGWTYSNLDEISADGQLLVRSFLTALGAEHPKRDIFACLKEDMFVLPSASLIDLEAFQAVGGFDEQLSGYEDDDLFLRLFLAGYDNVYIDTPLSQWRIYDTSSSYTPRMGRSRAAYARKLLAAFPDNTIRLRYYTRDLLIPRFYRQISAECRKAIAHDDVEALRTARVDLEFISGLVSTSRTFRRDIKDLLISVVIPLYNGAPYIEQAVRSVFRQSLPPAEVIVVDDGSTDDGVAIVERLAGEFPLKLLRKPNGGQSSARNLGVAQSGGDFIAFLDQDDIWYPSHLERLAQPFIEPRTRELGWVYSNLDEIDEKGLAIANSFLSTLDTQHPKTDLFACLREDMFILPSASLIARKAFDAVGGFDEQLSGYEDDDLFLRLFRIGYDNVYVDEPLSQWRIYLASSSYTPRMARSRMTYARKLFASFPDDPGRSRYYARDLIVPRFFRQMIADYMQAVRSDDPLQIREAADHFVVVAPFLSGRRALARSVLLSPIMANRLVARITARMAPVLKPMVRWLLRI